MGLIQHPKIGNLLPQWAPFHGFSLLFDNPGDCLTEQANGLQLLDNRPAREPALLLYHSLYQWLIQTGPALLMNSFGFCPLPASSFHVTVWDGMHEGQTESLAEESKPGVVEFLRALPDSMAVSQSFLEGVSGGALMQERSWRIRMLFSHLSYREQSGLAAVLKPADDMSDHLLGELISGRNRMSKEISTHLGFSHQAGEYVPHITLGYFLNPDLASNLSPHIEIAHWTSQLRKILQDVRIEFSSIGLYAYTDMVSFFRLGKNIKTT